MFSQLGNHCICHFNKTFQSGYTILQLILLNLVWIGFFQQFGLTGNYADYR